MTEFDEKIKQALRAESDNVWKDVEEQGLFEQALGVMRGQQRFITVMVYIVMTVFFVLMVYSIVRFFGAGTTRTQIAWAVSFLASRVVKATLETRTTSRVCGPPLLALDPTAEPFCQCTISHK